jgi:hypothetical protein
MKKIFFLLATAVTLTARTDAQVILAALDDENNRDNKFESDLSKEKKEERRELRKERSKEVSYMSIQNFQGDFPGITPTQWKWIDNFDEATFVKDGQTMSAFYDFEGKLVGTTQDKTFADLPPIAQKYINDKYQGYTPTGVIFYDDNEFNENNMILYNNEYSDEDSYFVEMQKGNERIVLHVKLNGDVLYYTTLK